MKSEFQIGDRKIGDGFSPFVIAEVGINHEGEFSKAIELVDAAVESGADCIKFQCHITEAEMVPTDMKPRAISEERLWDIIKRCGFSVTRSGPASATICPFLNTSPEKENPSSFRRV